MTKNEAFNTAPKAKWEAPTIDTITADLSSVEAAASPGTDGLPFSATSMS